MKYPSLAEGITVLTILSMLSVSVFNKYNHDHAVKEDLDRMELYERYKNQTSDGCDGPWCPKYPQHACVMPWCPEIKEEK